MTEVPGGVLAILLFAGVSVWGSPARGPRPPRTAAQLAVSVDNARLPDHDHLASYRGIAPRVRSSGMSVRASAQRRPVRRSAERRNSLAAQVCLTDVIVVQQLSAGAGHGDLAGLERVASCGNRKRHLGVLHALKPRRLGFEWGSHRRGVAPAHRRPGGC